MFWVTARWMGWILLMLLTGLSARVLAGTDDLTVTDMQLVASQRVGRSHYRYTYTIAVSNSAEALTGVTASVVSSSGATVIEDGQVVVGDVPAQSTEQSSDTFSFTQNRRYLFNPEALEWTFIADPAANNPPHADAGDDQSVTTGATVSLNGANSSDPDGDDLTYAWTLNAVPDGSQALLNDPGSVSPAFIADVSGAYVVSLIVNDGQENSVPSTLTVTASVGGENPPVITSTPVTTASLGVAYQYDVDATDPDQGDSISYSLDVAPAGMTINGQSGLVDWVPGATGAEDVFVTATDSTGRSATQFYLILTNAGAADAAPSLAPIADQTIVAGNTLMAAAIGTDPEGEALRYGLNQSPAGFGINALNGMLQWTPTGQQTGQHAVTVQVSDPGGQFAQTSFNVTVLPERENNDPVLGPVSDIQVNALELLNLQFSATDADANDILVFSLPGLPTGAQFDPIAGTLDWQPTSANTGTLNLELQVIDSAGGSDSASFSITVLEPAQAPIAVNDAYAIRLGETLNVLPEGVLTNDMDANNDVLTAVQDSAPSLGTLTGFSGNGAFTYDSPAVPAAVAGLEQKCQVPGFGPATTSEPAVADLDGDGTTEIVIGHANAALSVYRAATCELLTTIGGNANTLFPWGRLEGNRVAIADLDSDGTLEIFAQLSARPDNTLSASSWSVFNLNYDQGTDTYSLVYRWTTEEVLDGNGDQLVELNGNNINAHLSFADLEGDGSPEILVGFGATFFNSRALVVVFRPDGSIKWQHLGDFQTAQSAIPYVQAIDMDLDGTLEVLYHTAILSHNGDVERYWPVVNAGTSDQFNQAQRLFTSSANFDNDPFPETYARGTHSTTGQPVYYVFDDIVGGNGEVIQTGQLAGQHSNVVATIAQLDGDAMPEIVTVDFIFDSIVGENGHMHVYEHDGSLKWRHVAVDNSVAGELLDPTHATSHTSTTRVIAIDLDYDGTDELIAFYRTGNSGTIYAIDGDGSIFWQHPVPSLAHQTFQAPILVDVDQDGAVEIVWSRGNSLQALTVYEGAGETELPAGRSIKHQLNYQPTFVNADGTVPTTPANYWLKPGLNAVNKIAVPAGEADTTDQFTYHANDGSADSNVANVDIVIANSNPPLIVSTPALGASPGFAYTYGAYATDADVGDTLQWTLVGAPGGMTVDGNGIVSWTPDAGDQNTAARVMLIVTDTQGNSDTQTFTINVLPPSMVPDLTGEDETGAGSALATAGLALGVVRSGFSDTVPAGQVVSQSVSAGGTSAAGTLIDIVISLGPQPVFVPVLAGTPEGSAIATLQALGLDVGSLTRVNSETALLGTVISQGGTEGLQVPQGTLVDLVISGGPRATLELSRTYAGPGESVNVALQFYDNAGNAVLAPPDLVVDTTAGAGASGLPVLVSGSTLTSDSTTRGVYLVNASSISEGVNLSAELLITLAGAADGAHREYAKLSTTLQTLQRVYTSLVDALQNDLAAVPGLAGQLSAARDSVDLEALQVTSPMVLESGHLARDLEVGSFNGTDDVTFPQRLSALITEIEEQIAYLDNVDLGDPRDDDKRIKVLNQRLENVFSAVNNVGETSRAHLAQRSALHQLLSGSVPRLMRASADVMLRALRDAGLIAQAGGIQEAYAASRIAVPGEGATTLTFFNLPTFSVAQEIQMSIIENYYWPIVQRVMVSAGQLIAFQTFGTDTADAEGLITGASLSFHHFETSPAFIEARATGEYPWNFTVNILGPDVGNGLVDFEAAEDDFNDANTARERRDALEAMDEARRAIARGFQRLTPDEVMHGCILDFAPGCKELVFADGIPVVHSIGVGLIPAPVILWVYDAATETSYKFIAAFFRKDAE